MDGIHIWKKAKGGTHGQISKMPKRRVELQMPQLQGAWA
jgi:hypothetical protein